MDHVNTSLRRAGVVVVACGAYSSFVVWEVAAAVAVWLYGVPSWVPAGSVVRGLTALQWWFVALAGLGSFVVHVGALVLVRRRMRRKLRRVIRVPLWFFDCGEFGVRAGSLCGCLGFIIVMVCALVPVGLWFASLRVAARPVLTTIFRVTVVVAFQAIELAALGCLVEAETTAWARLPFPSRPMLQQQHIDDDPPEGGPPDYVALQL